MLAGWGWVGGMQDVTPAASKERECEEEEEWWCWTVGVGGFVDFRPLTG